MEGRQTPVEHPVELGSYALGALDADEADAVRRHLESCPRCRSELAEFEGVRRTLDAAPADLALRDLDDSLLDLPGTDGDLVLARTLRQVRTEGAQRRRTRVLAVAASVVALLGIGGGVGAVIGRTTAPAPAAVAIDPIARGTGPLVQTVDTGTKIGMTARVTPQSGWVRVTVRVTGAPAGASCRLFAIRKDGTRQLAGSWVIAQPGTGTPIQVAVAVPLADLDRLELISTTGKRWVTASV